ncbi:pentapeptide repeat-containing protein [Pseudomonas piscis]|uniref:Pentapeptide repeat-containing protein n=1 Tax=Pseudomonas piscis TaxID=2614538 RepID=A0A7X1U3Y3_9PSED|nr:pentapeptide repeat-containing protein [Pseudomonas piscis]MQA53445.1 pentapeptide repeat-containing protein [Pseudomonas piscis]WMN19940.1 pentapeptide repeat-containing protein [Pseudomonas piscis]
MQAQDGYFEITPEDLQERSLAQLAASQPLPVRGVGLDLSGQDLSRSNLAGAHFERCSFSATNLTAANLANSRWTSCRAGQATLRSAVLTDARFERCDLNNTLWQRSKVAHVQFEGCKLTGANFADVSALGLGFSDCLLNSAMLSGISFYKAQLYRIDFSEADLTYCDFRKAVFIEGGSLSLARVNNARFDDADLREASLQGLRLVDAKLFKGAIISRSQAGMLLAGLGLTVL